MNSLDIRGADFCLYSTQVLLHFLWQGTFIGGGAVLIDWSLRHATANARYLANVAALGMMLVCVPITFFVVIDTAHNRSGQVARPVPATLDVPTQSLAADATSQTEKGLPEIDAIAVGQGAASVSATSQPARRSYAPTIDTLLVYASPHATAGYMLGFVVMLGRLVVAHFRGERLRRNSVPVNDATLLTMIDLSTRAIGLKMAPVVACCQRVSGPVVVGLFRPSILLPAALVTGLSPDQLQAILTHELAHLRRYDAPVHLLQRLAEVALFFHPMAWYVSHRVSFEREQSCDDLVLSAGWQPLDYANALVRTAEICAALRGCVAPDRAALLAAVGERPSQFKRRVLRLLGNDQGPQLRLGRGTLILFVLLVGASVAAPMWTGSLSAAGKQAAINEESGGEKPPVAQPKAPQNREQQWRIRVNVVDEATGQPISNPRVGVNLGKATTWYDGTAAGNFDATLPTRTPNFCYLNIRADGYVQMRALWRNGKGQPPDPLPEEFTFSTVKAITVGGTVVDEQGQPVPDSTVLFSARDNSSHPGRRAEQAFSHEKYVTDAKGRWQCDLAPPNLNGGSIRVNHTDFAPVTVNWSVDKQIGQLRDKSYVWTLKRGISVRGRVVDLDGKPVEGAILAIGELDDYSADGPFTKTDADGRYEFMHVASSLNASDVANSRMTITVIKPGFAPMMKPVLLSPTEADDPARADKRTIDFVLARGTMVRIRVVNSAGEPQPGAWVIVDHWCGTNALGALGRFYIPRETNEAGIWEWSWAPPTDVIAYDIVKQGYMDVRNYTLLPPGDEGAIVTVTLKYPQWISGRVIDAVTKQPIADFVVQKGHDGIPDAPDRIFWTAGNTNGREGKYRKEISMPTKTGSYAYRVMADGYETTIKKLVPFEEGEVTLDFELQPQQQAKPNEPPPSLPN